MDTSIKTISLLDSDTKNNQTTDKTISLLDSDTVLNLDSTYTILDTNTIYKNIKV